MILPRTHTRYGTVWRSSLLYWIPPEDWKLGWLIPPIPSRWLPPYDGNSLTEKRSLSRLNFVNGERNQILQVKIRSDGDQIYRMLVTSGVAFYVSLTYFKPTLLVLQWTHDYLLRLFLPPPLSFSACCFHPGYRLSLIKITITLLV